MDIRHPRALHTMDLPQESQRQAAAFSEVQARGKRQEARAPLTIRGVGIKKA
jgi:hypothetical protein